MAILDFLADLVSSGLFDGRSGTKKEFSDALKNPEERAEIKRAILILFAVILGIVGSVFGIAFFIQ